MVYINNAEFVLIKDKQYDIENRGKKEKIIMKIMIKFKNIVVILKTKGMNILETEDSDLIYKIA